MEKSENKFFCCLNSRKSKHIEYLLLAANFSCLILYLIFFFTIVLRFVELLYQLLININLTFLCISIMINAYFINIRKNGRINADMNGFAFSLSILMIIICIISLILAYISSFQILLEFKLLYDKNIVFYTSKQSNLCTIISIILIDILWTIILFLWIVDYVRIKIKTDETIYNFLKIKSLKKNSYLFNDDDNKENITHFNKVKQPNKNYDIDINQSKNIIIENNSNNLNILSNSK